MKRRRFRIALPVAFVITIGWISLGAQAQFASFTGTVLGSDGNPVPGVEVVATNEARGCTQSPLFQSAPTSFG